LVGKIKLEMLSGCAGLIDIIEVQKKEKGADSSGALSYLMRPSGGGAQRNLANSLFRNILRITPLNSEILAVLACNSMIPIARGRGDPLHWVSYLMRR
jgi:hypothetical protein